MDRLRREGRWNQFVRRREQMKAAGIAAKEAWRKAAAEFPAEANESQDDPAEPLIPWAKARRHVNAAESDFDWIVRALPVDVPRRVAARKIGLYELVLSVRHNPKIRSMFCDLLLSRLDRKPVRG